MKERNEIIETRCPICGSILFTLESFGVFAYDDRTRQEKWVLISETKTPVQNYGTIIDTINNKKYFLCEKHFEKCWEIFKKDVKTTWQTIIERVKNH